MNGQHILILSHPLSVWFYACFESRKSCWNIDEKGHYAEQSRAISGVGLFIFFNGIRRVVYDCCSQLAKCDSVRIIKKGSPACLTFAVKAALS